MLEAFQMIERFYIAKQQPSLHIEKKLTKVFLMDLRVT